MLPVFRYLDVVHKGSAIVNHTKPPARHDRHLEGKQKKREEKNQDAGDDCSPAFRKCNDVTEPRQWRLAVAPRLQSRPAAIPSHRWAKEASA